MKNSKDGWNAPQIIHQAFEKNIMVGLDNFKREKKLENEISTVHLKIYL